MTGLRQGDQSPTRSSPREISQHEFSLLQKLIYDLSGNHLGESKSPLLVNRLTTRLQDLGLPSFLDYYKYLVDDRDPAERTRMLDCIVTNETSFFREPSQFEFLEHVVVPNWRRADWAKARARRIRVWSAGCSTGQEAYSVAMVLLTHFPKAAGWNVEVMGTDLSTRALQTAQAGIWPVSKASEIPDRYLQRFMRRGIHSQEGNMRATGELRSAVQFRRQNLKEMSCTQSGQFDLIFCRNVLIYFDEAARATAIESLASHLIPGGYFFIGHAETLKGLTNRLETVAPTIYTTAAGGAPSSLFQEHVEIR